MQIYGLLTSIRFRLATLIAPELGAQAMTDPLTGANNFRAFEEHLARESAAVRRGAHRLGLLMIDMNHFKAVNDTYGHEVGNVALRLVVETIKSCVRGTDVVCRYGGDEFVVLLHTPINATGILVAAERIIAALAARQIKTSKGSIGVTVSIGGAIAEDGSDVDSLVGRADAKLFEAKKLKSDGKSHVAV
jgi:two-component system cell cycle response regulator